MSLIHFKPEDARPTSASSKEKAFLEQYDWLYQSALSLTRGQKERAEDLVHDVFVQFQIKIKKLEDVEDLRGYFYGMLRNLYLSQLRSATRHPIQPLSILDHDSAFVGLRAHDFSDQLHATKLLTVACEFVSYRKESTLTASIFILRYFHCYYPDEIAVLLAAQRENVDRWLSRGRSEAKVFLTEPYPIPKSSAKAEPSSGSQLFLVQLRGIIFASCATPCPAHAKTPAEFFFGTQELAHLVSCPACLDKRSKHLGLPALNERVFEEPHQRDDRGGPPAGSGGSGSFAPSSTRARANKLRKGYARTRELLKHHPAELSMAVDGHIRTTHVIGSSLSLLNLTVDAKERVDFVEILSEQGVRFLFLDRHDLETLAACRYDITLSDGRLLEVEIVPDAQGPCIQVSYRDPGIAPLPTKATNASRLLFDPHNRLTLWAALQAWFSGLPGHLRIFGALTASACVVATLSLVLWKRSGYPLQSADPMQAVIDQERALPLGAAAHSIYSYEEDDNGGHRQQAGEVDVWRQTVPSRLALRFYDPHHALLLGFFQDLHGSVEYRNQTGGIDQNPAQPPRNWQDAPSAERFASLLAPGAAPEIARSDDQYRIVVHSPQSRPELLNAVLVIDRRTLRAVEADYDVRDPEGVHHVRMREASYQIHPANGMDHGVFDVARDFNTSSKRSRNEPNKFDENNPDAARLELQVLTDLMRAGAQAGEQLDIHRDRQMGIVEVRGVVDTPERKTTLLDAIAPLLGNDLLKVAVRSSEDVPQLSLRKPLKRKRNQVIASSNSTTQLDTFQAPSSTIPADAAVRRYWKSQGLASERLDSAIQQFAEDACDESLIAQQHAYRLAQLTSEFTPADLAHLDAGSRLMWLVLVSNYSEALDADLKSLHRHLSPILGSAATSAAASELQSLSPLSSPSELAAASREILSLTARLNQKVRSAFSIAAVSHDSQPDPQLEGDSAFSEIAHLLDAVAAMAGNISATAQRLPLFATRSK